MSALVLDSKQSGTISYGTGESGTKTAALTGISDISQCLVLVSARSDNADAAEINLWYEITNKTTLTVSKYQAGANTEITWQVLEFSSGLSQTTYTSDPASTSVNITISISDTAKAFPIISLENSGTSTGNDDHWFANITSTTNCTIGIQSGASSGNQTIKLTIYEIDDATVAKYTGNLDADASTSVTVTAVTIDQTLLAYTYGCDDVQLGNDERSYAYLTSTTNVNLLRDITSGGDDCEYYLYTINISDGVEVQHYNVTAITSGSKATTISPAVSDVDATALHATSAYGFMGTADATGDDAQQNQGQLSLDSTSQFTVTRYTTSGSDQATCVQVIEFVDVVTGVASSIQNNDAIHSKILGHLITR